MLVGPNDAAVEALVLHERAAERRRLEHAGRHRVDDDLPVGVGEESCLDVAVAGVRVQGQVALAAAADVAGEIDHARAAAGAEHAPAVAQEPHPLAPVEPIALEHGDVRRQALRAGQGLEALGDRDLVLPEVDALGSQLVAVENNLGLRLIELQIGIGEHELAAGERLGHQLLREVGDARRLLGRHDHQLHRESFAAAGQRRRDERNESDAGNL